MPKKRDLRVREIIKRTYDVVSVRLDEKDADFNAGQFMIVALQVNPDIKRYLSISNSPTEKGYIEFTKKLTASDFSGELGRLQKGDIVGVEYPMGNFTLRPPDRKIAFLSGGIGITPIRSMCQYAVDTEAGTDMVLLYGNQSARDIVFENDFTQMTARYPGLKVVHVLREPAPNMSCRAGLINKDIIEGEMPDYKDRRFYIGGPPAMVLAMKKIVTEDMALAPEQVITENFAGY